MSSVWIPALFDFPNQVSGFPGPMFHSISHEAQDPALTATDLLAYDLEQLVRHLKRNRDDDGGFDISGLVGVERLSMRRLGAHGALVYLMLKAFVNRAALCS